MTTMKNNLLLLLVAATTVTGCNTKKTTATESDAATETASESAMATGSVEQCYALMATGDTVRLNLTQQGSDVTGTLLIQLAGKDRNTGTLRGQMRGDTLLAKYTFQSEGQASVREVAFLAKDGGFVEGYGDVQEQNGAMVFTPGTTLTFGTDRVLTKTDCPNQP